MAYVQQQNEEDQKNNPAQGPISPAGGGVHTSATSGIGNASMGSGTGGQTQPQAGGQFASLTNYVQANQGNAAPIANNITNQANSQLTSLQGQNQQALQGIQGQVDQGYTKYDPTLLAQENADPVSFTGGSSGALKANPIMAPGSSFGGALTTSAPTDGQSNISSFQKQLNDQYNGPSSAASTNSFQNQQATVNNAIAKGQQLQGTEAGNQQLIGQSEKVTSPSTTGLNEAILYNDPNASAQVQHAYDPFSSLTTQLTQGAGTIDQNIAGAQGEANQASTQANKQLQDQLNGVNTNITNQNTQAFNTANTNYSNLMGAFNKTSPSLQADIDAANANPTGPNRAKVTADLAQSAPNLTPDQLSQLGLTSDQFQTLMQDQNKLATSQFVASPFQGNGSAWTQAGYAPINQFITGAAPTQDQFASVGAQDQATGNALNTLAGSNIFTAPTGGAAYKGPTFDFNTANTDYQQAIQQQQQAALDQANGVANSQQAQHQASKQKGGILGGIVNDISHPGNLLGSLANPLSWGANLENLANGKEVSPTNINPLKPTSENLATPVVNSIPQVKAANSVGQKLGVQSAAFGGIIEDLKKQKAGK